MDKAKNDEPKNFAFVTFQNGEISKRLVSSFLLCLLMKCDRNPEAYQISSSGKTRRGRDVQNKDRDQTGKFLNLFSCSKYDLILIMIIGPPGDHERPSDASQRPSPPAHSSSNWGQGSHGRRTYVKVKGYNQISISSTQAQVEASALDLD